MEIQYEKAAVKYLKGLQKPQRDLILDAIEKLTHKPAEGDIKKMSGYKEIEVLCIMDVGSRGDIYK